MRRADSLVASAPARVDFTGGYTDVSPFCEYRSGRAVNAAIALFTHAEGRLREDGRVKLISDDLQVSIEADSVDDLQFDGRLDLIKAIIKKLVHGTGIELRTRSDTPPASGLGTSGALGVAVVGLIDALAGHGRTRQEIAELAATIEREAGIAGGRQDQYAAALGGIQYLECAGDTTNTSKLDLGPDDLKVLEENLLLSHPGGTHDSGGLVRRVMLAYQMGDTAVISHLLLLNQLAAQIKDALSARNCAYLIQLVNEVRLHQRGLLSEITNAEVEGIISALEGVGVSATKATGGAGPGACLLSICSPPHRSRAIDLLERHRFSILPFKIDMTGLRIVQATEYVVHGGSVRCGEVEL